MAITRENIAHFYEKYKENLKTEESVIEQFTKADTKENWVANLKKKYRSMKMCIRDSRSTESAEEGFVSFKTHEECSAWLSFQTGNILLTTGSKDLGSYAKNETIKNHLFVRVLPGEESIRLCTANGITGRQIIAMQGPFSAQMNECILREYSIDWMVTKISGHAGGFEEKVEAAKKAGVGVCAILPRCV